MATGRVRWSLAALAALGLVMVLSWWLAGVADRANGSGTAPAPTPAAGQESAAARPAVAPRSDLPPPARLVTDVAPTRPADDRLTLTGRVLWSDDRLPVADAEVSAHAAAWGPIGPVPGELLTRAAADGQGRFELAVAAPTVVAALFARDPDSGSAGSLLRASSLTADDSRPEDGLLVLLDRPGQVSGVVRDLQGRLVSGALVSAWNHAGGPDAPDSYLRLDEPSTRETRTDAQGRFLLAGLGPRVRVRATAPGHVPVRAMDVVMEGRPRVDELELVLAPARALTVRLQDARGRSLPDCELTATRVPFDRANVGIPGCTAAEDLRFELRTGPDGRARLPNLTDESWRFNSPGPGGLGRLHQTVPVATHGPHDELVLTVPGDLRLAGVVLADGEPVAGATLTVPLGTGRVAADGQGRFELWIEDQHRQALSVLAHGVGRAVGSLALADVPAGREDRLVIQLPAAEPLEGWVVDGEGRPVVGARVQAFGDELVPGLRPDIKGPQTIERFLGLHGSISDSDGRFRIDGLAARPYRVVVRDVLEPWQRSEVSVPASRPGAYEVVLDRRSSTSATVRLAVRDGHSGEPVPRFTVRVFTPEPSGALINHRPLDVQQDQGLVELPGLPSGPCQIQVDAIGHAQGRLHVELSPGPVDLALELLPQARLEIEVRDQSGEPMGSVRVQLSREDDGRGVALNGQLGGQLPWRTTASDGRLLLTRLPATRLRVTVSSQARASFLAAPWPGQTVSEVVDLSDALDQRLVVALERPADVPWRRVHLDLRDEDGLALDRPVELTVLGPDGAVLARGRVAPEDRKWVTELHTVGAGRSTFESSGQAPFALITVPLRDIPLEVHFEAEGLLAAPVTLQPEKQQSLVKVVFVR